MRTLLTTLLIACAFALTPAPQAEAAPREGIVVAQGGMSLNQAVEQVRRQYPNARIVSASTKVVGGREVHHIRIDDGGKIRTIKVPGRARG